MSIGLVTYFSPNARYGSGFPGMSSASGPDLGSINGEPVTREQLGAAEKEAAIFFRLRSGAWPNSEEQKKQVLQMAQQAMVLQSLINEYKIDVTTEAAARFTKRLFGVPLDQALPADKFNDWIQNELRGKGGLSLDDFDHFARHQAGQEYLLGLFGMTGELITPKEAEFFYRRENERMVTEIAAFPTSHFYASTAPSDAELQDYFTKHAAEYRLPDRVQINYIDFEPSNYYAKADVALGTNLDDRVAEIYRQQGAAYFKDESNQPLSEAVAKDKVKKQMRLIAALQETKKEANDFLRALSEGHDDAHPYAPSNLETLAKTKGLTVKTTKPFDEQNGCPELDLPPKTLHVLFSLRENAPDDQEKSLLYAPSPLVSANGTNIYVAGLQQRMPSQLQTLAQVRDQVLKDYRESKALALAKEAGEKFAAALQASLTQGKTFDAVCAEQHVKPESLPPFALTSSNVPPGMDKASFQQLQEAIFPLPSGQSSKFIPTTDGGVVAQVKERMPVDEARMQQELPYYLSRMREQRQVAAFQQWLGRQMQLRWIPPPGNQSSPG